MNITEIIQKRHSVRTYDAHPLTEEEKAELISAVDTATDPFGGQVTIRLRSVDPANDFKPSTYGVIKGAADYFLIGIGSDEASALSAGFRFEQVVLKATEMGLGTCWIAATFRGTVFSRGIDWPDGQQLRIVSPVGRPHRPRLLERVTRMTFRSDKRKPFETLFFDKDFNTPLSPEGRFAEALRMLRLAPSSTNSQPWRALVDGDCVHFYYQLKSPLSILDCGIALSHFSLAHQASGASGRFYREAGHPVPPEGLKYLYSYIDTSDSDTSDDSAE